SNGTLGTVLLDPENITIGAGGDISEASLEALPADANVILEATNNVTINQLADNALNFAATTGAVTIRADSGNFTWASSPVSPIFSSPQITTQGGNLTIEAANFISTGSLNVVTSSTNRAGGDVTLKAANGAVDINNVNSSSTAGAGG